MQITADFLLQSPPAAWLKVQFRMQSCPTVQFTELGTFTNSVQRHKRELIHRELQCRTGSGV
ncbi:UNVERIFIED_CONTAM: hypothetical protein FKN15_040481 [Acipenser sinensis]